MIKSIFQNQKGFSIIELLIVTLVFTILAVLATQSIALTLKGSRKSEAVLEVRQNLDYAFSVMERQIRPAEDVSCTDTELSYTDENGVAQTIVCQTGPPGYLEFSGERLTNPEINIDCSSATPIFSCPDAASGVPDSIEISITATDANALGAEGAKVTTTTKFRFRSY